MVDDDDEVSFVTEEETESLNDSSSLIFFEFCSSWVHTYSPFVAVLRISETACDCSLLTRLYAGTPSILLWPVLDIMSCSSTPLLNSLVAAVTRKE